MFAETPRLTTALIAVSLHTYENRYSIYVYPATVAKLTGTSTAYWEALHVKGTGPKLVPYKGYDWYILGDVQDWLDANISGFWEVA